VGNLKYILGLLIFVSLNANADTYVLTCTTTTTYDYYYFDQPQGTDVVTVRDSRTGINVTMETTKYRKVKKVYNVSEVNNLEIIHRVNMNDLSEYSVTSIEQNPQTGKTEIYITERRGTNDEYTVTNALAEIPCN